MKKLLWLFLLFFALLGCKDTKPTEQTSPTETILEEEFSWDNIVFEGKTVDYTGEEYSLEVQGVVGGAKVTYSPKYNPVDPGIYSYKATVEFEGEKRDYFAKLVINHMPVTLTAEEVQTCYLTDGVATVKYSLDVEDEDVFVNVEEYVKPGTYEVTLKTSQTKYYAESNEVVVTLNVLKNRSGLSFESQTLVTDGSENVGLTVTDPTNTDLLEKYDIEYVNNDQNVQGKYQVSANIFEKGSDECLETLHAILTVDYENDAEFSTYADEMFVYLFSGDQLSTNIFMINPEDFGIEHSDAVYYTYEAFTEEEWNSDKAEVARLIEELHSYDDNKLSYAQISTKTVIAEALKNYENVYADMDAFFMDVRYVDQYGGYCANIPTYLEAYSLRCEQDIKDVISYVDSTYDAFLSYFEYIEAREEHGYGYSLFTLEKMQEYLDGVVKDSDSETPEGQLYGLITPDDYYIYPILSKKITESGSEIGLTTDQINAYNDDLYAAFNAKFIPAHHDLSKAIEDYITAKTAPGEYLEQVNEKYISFTEGYLPNYDGGKEYYKNMLFDNLGVYDQTMEDIIAFLDEAFAKYFSLYLSNSSLSDLEQRIADGGVSVFGTDDPFEILAALKEFAKTIVPELEGDPQIDVAYMDKTITANTTTLAYYMKSPLDGTLNEYIHLNGDAIANNRLETAMTLAHEGYPGHLYAYVYSKEASNLHNINRVFTNTGHAEGWAKYVEYALGNYLAELKDSDSWQRAMNYNSYYSLFAYTLQARIDIGVNYQGWNVKGVEKYLENNKLNPEIAEDIYYACIEAPTQIVPYGYGMAKFVAYHDQAKEALGGFYDEVDFNRMLLSNGWCSFTTLEQMVEEYINNQCFVYGLTNN